MSEYGLRTVRERTRAASSVVRSRSGFTLVEFVVAVVLFAALSAVVIPAAVSQMQKAEVTSIVRQLEEIQTGITGFYTDVSRYPAEVNQLVHEPPFDGGSGVTGLNGAQDLEFEPGKGTSFGKSFPPGRIKRWDGPYISKGYIGASIPTSFNGGIERAFGKVCVGRTTYISVDVTGLTEEAMKRIDLQKDEEAGPSDGLIRYTTGTPKLQFLAVSTGSAPPCS